MPGVGTNAPYDSAETVLTFVRTILADYIQNAANMAGDIFSDTQPYTLPTLNLGWRKLQRKMALAGHPRVEAKTVLVGLPVVNAAVQADPATECYIAWNGCFDGQQLLINNVPSLPVDLMFPIKLGERQTGTVYRFSKMDPATDGLPSVPPGSWNRWWDWRAIPGSSSEAIYVKGSTISLDMEIRYASFMPDIIAAQGGLSQTPIPVMRCAEALAYYTCACFVSPRENGAAKSLEYEAAGDKALAELIAQPAKQIMQRATYRRIPAIRSGRGRYLYR